MEEELTRDPLLEEALDNLRKARMLVGFVKETLRYPDVRKSLRDEVNEVSKALEAAIEATSEAIAMTADADAILSLFLYRTLSQNGKERKDE